MVEVFEKMHYSLEWSTLSFIFYVTSGFIFFLSSYFAKLKERKCGEVRHLFSIEYFVVYLLWSFIFTFRSIDYNVGGADALSYIYEFSNFFYIAEDGIDYFWYLFNFIIRIFTDDYHWFFVIYSIILTLSFVAFTNQYSRNIVSCIPLSIVFFIFLRSFNTMRSNFAISMLLFAIVFLGKNKHFKTCIFAIFSAFSHISGIVYVGFLAFYYLLKNEKITIKKVLLFFIASCIFTVVVQNFIQGYADFFSDKGSGAYSYYASRNSIENLFFTLNASVFGQILMFVILAIFRKKIDVLMNDVSEQDKQTINILRLACYYDFILVPFVYTLGIWRGYEFFFLIRLSMLGEIVTLVQNRFKGNVLSNFVVSCCIYMLFIGWFYLHLSGQWEDSKLMPYVFLNFEF